MRYPAIIALCVAVAAAGLALPAASAASPGEEWGSIKGSLSDGEKAEGPGEALDRVGDAEATYRSVFMPTALELDPESHRIIEQAFDRIKASHDTGDVAQAKLERQAVDKTIYTIAYLKIEQALDTGDSRSFSEWFTVMEEKFNLSENHPDLARMGAEISADASVIPGHSEPLRAGLLEIFKLKTLEEPEEALFALQQGDIPGAQKFAYEGYYYYRTLHPAVEEKVGAERASELLQGMDRIIGITMSGISAPQMSEEIGQVLDEITMIIREYEGTDSSEEGLALAGIKDRLLLVEIEYADAVTDGRITDQKEYDETVAFLGKAAEIYDSNRDALAALSGTDTDSLRDVLAGIDSAVSSLEDPSEVSILVGRGLNAVASLEDLAGGAVETDVLQYFEEIERLLDEAGTNYRDGDAQLALDQVGEAYLDNYEFLEGPLGEVDAELMLKIEDDMREGLRSMIREGAHPDEVDAQIGVIRADLDAAKQVIPEFGAVATAVLAAAIVSIIALSAKSGTIRTLRF